MLSDKKLARKIESIHGDFGQSGKDFRVSYDDESNAWAVDIRNGRQHLKTFVETIEADSCVEEGRCIPLALQTGQLKYNFEKYLHEHALEKDNRKKK